MKYILITRTFQKQLKKFRRHCSLEDVLTDVKNFITTGGGKHAAELKQHKIADIALRIVKLRLTVYKVQARYLLGIAEGERDYIPIIIDLKTGRHGANLSFDAKKETQEAIETALEGVIHDYITHTDNDPHMSVYKIEE